MLDTTQILMIIILSITTIFLAVIGIQLILVLKEFKKLLLRANNVMDSVEKAGFGITRGYSEVLGFFSGMKNVIKVIDHVSDQKTSKTKKSK